MLVLIRMQLTPCELGATLYVNVTVRVRGGLVQAFVSFLALNAFDAVFARVLLDIYLRSHLKQESSAFLIEHFLVSIRFSEVDAT